jgi:hypothetical protein
LPKDRAGAAQNTMINRLIILASVVCTLFVSSAAFGQTPAIRKSETRNSGARAIAALRRLDRDVIIYRSLGDFAEGRKLSQVPLDTFEQHFNEVRAEVTSLLNEMPAGKMKNDLSNALDSYQDGLFWWKQTEEPRVVNIRSLGYASRERSAADAVLRATVPYTVATHWRHAHDYLARAERNL